MRLSPEEKQRAVAAIVETLRPFQHPERGEGDYGLVGFIDEEIREVVRTALRELQVYNAGGCPLCLS